jgi:hypothetical protein
MAVRRSFSPTLGNQTYRLNGNPLKTSTDYNFPIQTTPPLSLLQYARSVAPIPGSPPWFYAYRRKYSIPTYTLKNYKDRKPKLPEPIWHPPSPYKNKSPTSLSPEKIRQKPIHEPVWQPIGRSQYKPVPYFDPPNLRWSIQELIKSMTNLQAKPIRASKNTSLMKSQ